MRKLRRDLKGRLLFLRQFLRRPLLTGGVTPSSMFLGRKMAGAIDGRPRCVVELGAGDGRMTRRILEKVPRDCMVIAVEKQPEFMTTLRGITDRRLVVVNDSAANLPRILRGSGVKKADHIISCLPMSWLGKDEEDRILASVRRCLKDGGKYIQYHHLLPYNLRRYKEAFSHLALRFTLLNLPPSFIFICQK